MKSLMPTDKEKKEEVKHNKPQMNKIRWKTICVETKNYVDEPKKLITGEVDFIHPTGDLAFKKITGYEIWDFHSKEFQKKGIPPQYKNAKKIVIKNDNISLVLCLEAHK